MRPSACARVLAVAIVCLAPTGADADWRLTPFAGAAFRTTTTYPDLDDAARRTHVTFGAAITRVPARVIGIDVEISAMPSLFTGHDLVESSGMTALSGSVLFAAPARWMPRVRPYVTIGAGVVHVTSSDVARVFPIGSTRAAATAAVGAWATLTPRLGARAQLRFLRSGAEQDQFETWQLTGGVAFRF
jgi:opacity protein-like surface antigen